MKPMLKQAHLQTAQCRLTDQSLQKSLLCQRTMTDQMSRQSAYRQEGRTANKVLPKAGVTNFYDSFVLNRTLVFQINSSAETPRLRQYPNR